MKICWDNLEGIKLSRYGNLSNGSRVYTYIESCINCGEPYLTCKCRPSKFCSISCRQSGEFNTMYGVPSPNTGKVVSTETRSKISEAKKGIKRSKESTIKQSISVTGNKNSQWKGGVKKKDLPLYETYFHQVAFAEETREYNDTQGIKLLQVRCAYCNKWFTPRAKTLKSRIETLNGLGSGESRLYCSVSCKESCPVFGRQKYPKGFKIASSREVDPYVRKSCFERDNWQCQRCFSIQNLHCHHIKGYTQNKILSHDIDNCITLCKKCHKEVHTKKGCKYNELRCKEE